MPAILDHWKVLPHGQLTAVDDKVWTVTGTIHMPVGDFERRMSVVRLRDGRLVIWSAIALDEPEMARLEAFGRPAWLVVPGDDHRMDARIWLQRYPHLDVANLRGGLRQQRADITQPVRRLQLVMSCHRTDRDAAAVLANV